MDKLIRKYGWISIAIGVLLIVAVIAGEYLVKQRWHTPEDVPAFLAFGLQFGDHLAVAFFSIGLIGMFFEVKEWRERFRKELSDIVNDVDQLLNLTDEELIKRYTNLLQARLKTKAIKQAGSMLEFYFNKIERFIASPYRESTTGYTKITFSNDKKSFVVEERISYTCQPLGAHFQTEVQWTAKQDEIEEIAFFQIRVRVPDTLFNAPHFKEDHPRIKEQDTIFDMDSVPPTLMRYGQGHGYTLSLGDYQGISGLFVETRVTYVVHSDRAFSWSMPFPSKGLLGDIYFPQDLEIYVDSFWFEPDETDSIKFEEKKEQGHYHYSYSSWLLPGDGFAFHFRKP